MPSKSTKQRRFMAAAANNPKFAKKAGIKQSVAREFHNADKRAKKYQGGGLASAKMGYRPHPGKPMAPRPMPASHSMMRRPPPRGGLETATKPMPPRPSVPPTPPSGVPRTLPKERFSERVPPRGRFGRNRPVSGALSAYTETGGSSGAPSGRQLTGGARNRIAGRIPGRGAGNGLLRTASSAYRDPGNRLHTLMNRTRFAKGGRVEKAVKALREARSWLFDASETQPEIAKKLLSDVPGGQKLKDSIDEARMLSLGLDPVHNEKELRQIFQALQNRFEDAEFALRESAEAEVPSMQERQALLEEARSQVDQLRTPAAFSADPEVNMLIRQLREKTRKGGQTTPEVEQIIDRLEELDVDWPEFLP